MSSIVKIEQFSVCKAYSQRVVILTNTLFNEVDSILVAPVKIRKDQLLISGLQIPVIIEEQSYYVDLLDIATISKNQFKPISDIGLQLYRDKIKAGIDLLIDGF